MIKIEGFLGAYINFILAIAPKDNSFLKLIIDTFDYLFQNCTPTKKNVYVRMFINVVREYCNDVKIIK